jgi:hypothetical protein
MPRRIDWRARDWQAEGISVEINLTPERIFRLLPQVSLDDAARRVESKKVSLVAGTLGSLLARPNPDDIELTYTESP